MTDWRRWRRAVAVRAAGRVLDRVSELIDDGTQDELLGAIAAEVERAMAARPRRRRRRHAAARRGSGPGGSP